jgi:hypothetical protein
MLVNPGLVRETLHESRLDMRTEYEANDQADSYWNVRRLFGTVHACNIHPPIMPPILTARC